MRIKDNVMLLEYFYGDDYTYETPYDISLEDTMNAIGKLIEFEQVTCTINKTSHKYGTGMSWTCELDNLQSNGITMLEACYNALVKYVKNEKEKENSE